MVQQNNTSESIKKSQNTTSQKLLLAKNYIEQKLETQGYRGHVRYDQTNKALIQYRVKEGTVAVLQKGKLCIFEMPMKKFKGAYPLEVQSVDMDSIQTQKATCCSRCHTWRQQADITRCSCGGYLVPRKRFSVDTVESWDVQFLAIEAQKKDDALAKKIGNRWHVSGTDLLERYRQKRARVTENANMAGGVAREMDLYSHQEELLLIPNGDDVKTVKVRPIESCSLIFVAAISRKDKPVTDTDKLEILKKYNLEPVNDDAKDRQFKSEAKQFIKHTTPILSAEMMGSWNDSATSRRQSKVHGRKARSLVKKYDRPCSQEIIHAKNSGNKKNSKGEGKDATQFFVSSLPIPA